MADGYPLLRFRDADHRLHPVTSIEHRCLCTCGEYVVLRCPEHGWQVAGHAGQVSSPPLGQHGRAFGEGLTSDSNVSQRVREAAREVLVEDDLDELLREQCADPEFAYLYGYHQAYNDARGFPWWKRLAMRRWCLMPAREFPGATAPSDASTP